MPPVKTKAFGMRAIRYFSEMNTWMDCVVFVSTTFASAVARIIKKAMDAWWAGDPDIPYGDAIETALQERHIPYAIAYYREHPDDPDSSNEEWSEFLHSIRNTMSMQEISVGE